MIDIHSHIIPNIDDGSKSEEISLAMLKRAEETGTTKIIATPHFFKGYWTEGYKSLDKRVEDLRKLAKDNNLNIEIYKGQEVYFNNYILEDYKLGDIGTLANSRYMLIEFPMDKINFQKTINELYELKIMGIVPVIAHAERYMDFINNPELINQFIDEGYLFQLNGGSLTGVFGREVKKTAELFLENNIYSFIGSDAHSDGQRNTDLREACEAANTINRGSIINFEENSLKLLNNEEVIFKGEKIKKKKKGLFSFFRR